MNVLALNDELVDGGAAQLFRRTNEILRRAGHEVLEVTGAMRARRGRPMGAPAPEDDGGALAAQGSRPGRRGLIEALRQEIRANVRQVYDPQLIGTLTELLDQRVIDVAHVHNLHGRLSTQVLPFLKRRGIPMVYQVNDYFFFCNTYMAYNRRLDQPCKRCIRGNLLWAVRYGCVNNLGESRFDRALLQAVKRLALLVARPWKAVDLFLVTSEQAAGLLDEWGVGPQRRLKIFNPMVSGECDVPTPMGDEVVFYGTCLPNKGTETFLAALEHVDASCPIGVYLTGMSADYAARLRAVAERRGFPLQVDSTLRWHHGLKERVASARAVVVPSQWWVTSENVVLEASLLGKPVIVSRIGGNMELVDHGQTGFVFEPRNAGELAGYINRLAADRDLARRMGAQASRRLRTRFTEATFVQQLEAAYRRAMTMAGHTG